MKNRQLEVMKLRVSPAMKLVMIAMIEKPDASRRVLAEFMNMDKTQLTSTTNKLEALSLIKKVKVEDSTQIRYEVLV